MYFGKFCFFVILLFLIVDSNDFSLFWIFKGSGGGKIVILKEGEVIFVKIEVIVEDGSINKNYFIYVIWFFLSDVLFSDFKFFVVINFCLKFVFNVVSYLIIVLFNFFFVEVVFVVVDKKIVVKINGRDLKEIVYLNYGEIFVEIEVIFLDGSNK